MTRDEFMSNAIALVGTSVGWQTKLAKLLEVDSRTIRRAVKDGPSDKLAAHLLRHLGEPTPQTIVPEWIEGDAANGRTYLIHTRRPRFICMVCDARDVPPTDDGIVFQNGDQVLRGFVWQDPIPDNISMLMNRACDALEEIADKVY